MPRTMTSTIAGPAASALSRGYTENFSPQAKTRQQEEREERRLRAKQRNAELGDLEIHQNTQEARGEVQAQELEVLRQQNEQVMGENARQTAFSALDRYTESYDPRHLNAMLKDLKRNPVGDQLFGKAARADRVTEADRELLEREGLDADQILNTPQLRNELIKVTDTDGEVGLESLTQIAAMTGYEQYANQRELQRQREMAEIAQLQRNFGYRTENERQAHRQATEQGFEPGSPEYEAAFNEAFNDLRQSTRAEFGSRSEREALRIVEEEGISRNDPGFRQRYNQVHNDIVNRERQTAPSREMDEVEQTRQRINEVVTSMGKESFFDLDPSDPKTAAQIEPHIQRMERLGNLNLSTDEQRRLTHIKKLISVADPAAQMTDRETGLIDRFTNEIQNYLTDNVEGRQATAAYSAFRNTFRNAMLGTQFTPHQAAEFNRELGTLGQQTGPVLSQFRVALGQVKAELESLYAMNDSYVTHYRLGVSRDHLDDIIMGLDERIEYFSRATRGPSAGGPGSQQERPAAPALDDNSMEGLREIQNRMRTPQQETRNED